MNRSSDSIGAPIKRQSLSLLLAFLLLLTNVREIGLAAEGATVSRPSSQEPQYSTKTPEQLQQLVAPIALYPDSLVAQILPAATFPEQVVEADRWLQAHPDIKGDRLAKAVDQQSWDPSVKALAAFPSVLGNMDKNLSWTSSLGDAYYNQQEDVMAAVQVMRQKAEQAGNLKTNQQQVVKTEQSTIVIEPANPDVVYVPAYDPWVVYGYPVVVWPGWYAYPGIWYSGNYVWFGVGFAVGYYYYYGWGWHHWGCDWHHHWAEHDHRRYYSRSRTFYHRDHYYRTARNEWHSFSREGTRTQNRNYSSRKTYNHSGTSARQSGNDTRARNYSYGRFQSKDRSGAFSNYGHGGDARTYSARGRASAGGGGFPGGRSSHSGGGFGGGGIHRGGGHR